jgi:hypothetical protein
LFPKNVLQIRKATIIQIIVVIIIIIIIIIAVVVVVVVVVAQIDLITRHWWRRWRVSLAPPAASAADCDRSTAVTAATPAAE